ncbi:GAP family protein [Streptomyces beijiangensis]|uniref:GAP family protein n=1 Tax=Streptomyces beijiangensis TaxID=163361 RepID=A0A939F9L0_9ACTN|nr:GAP family protein [Streptomyces beijiangensis]MBO0514256.1 GAP family protein [Streptomyces beijiangensis]
MGDAIGQMLTSAVGIAISPLPLIAVILMLATPRGRSNGIAFALGWTLSLAVLVTVVVLAGSGADASGDEGPATWTLWLKLALGVLFLLMGAKQWRERPREGQDAKTPGWMAAIDKFTPGKSAGMAAALAVANPKNLVLAVGGAVSIASSTADGGGKTVAAVLMVVIASLCATLPLAVFLFGGAKATEVLAGWKAWMSRHNAAIMTTVLVILGFKYVGDAISGLTA